jgi:hypothetical protein
MNQSEFLCPGAVPENEIVIPDDPSFVAACIESIADHVEKCDLRFGKSISTRHGHWGLVWRVNIESKHESAQSPARQYIYICWRPPDMEDGIGGTAYVYAKNEDRIK